MALGGRGTLSAMRGGERPNEGSSVAALLEELVAFIPDSHRFTPHMIYIYISVYIMYTDINMYIYIHTCRNA